MNLLREKMFCNITILKFRQKKKESSPLFIIDPLCIVKKFTPMVLKKVIPLPEKGAGIQRPAQSDV